MEKVTSQPIKESEGTESLEEIIAKYAKLGQTMALLPNDALATSAVGFLAYKMNKDILSRYEISENKEWLLAASTVATSGLFYLIKKGIDGIVRKNPPLALITAIFSVSFVTGLVFKIQGNFLISRLSEGKWSADNLLAASMLATNAYDFNGLIQQNINEVLKSFSRA